MKIGSDYELAAFIEKKIGEEGYSPAAVVGEIKRLGLTFKTEISEKTIYNYIDKGIFYGISRESLPEHGERKRKYDKVERKKAARAPQGESIEERPQEINDRQTFGHWEGDCVCGKKRTKGNLVRSFGRLTRNEIIIKMPDQTARQRRGGAEQIRTPLREEVFTDIQKALRLTTDRNSWIAPELKKIRLRQRPEAHEGLLLPPVQRIRTRHE